MQHSGRSSGGSPSGGSSSGVPRGGLEGSVLGHYHLLTRIGRGGMGEVYRAHDRHLDRDVAIKVLPPDLLRHEAARRRFRREAFALSRLNHPNIATVHDFDTLDGIDVLVMEYVAGTDLASHLEQEALSERQVIEIGVQIAAALEEAHEAGIVHRDLKPQNVMLDAKGLVKVLDFGLAQLVGPADEFSPTVSLPDSRHLAGTVPYMAPEQLRGESVDARSDIYAFGAVLYEMATGRPVFTAASQAGLIADTLGHAPTPPRQIRSHVSAELERVVLKALDKDRGHRYQTARELRVDLERIRLATPAPSPWRPTLGGKQAVVGLLLVALTLILVWKRIFPPQPEPSRAVMTALVTGPASEGNSHISPDSEWFSYETTEEGRWVIRLQRMDSGQARLTIPVEGDLISHLWSSDGTRIAVLTYPGAEPLLQVVPAFGGAPLKSLSLAPTFANARLVRWIDATLYLDAPLDGLWQLELDSEDVTKVLPAAGSEGFRTEFDVCMGGHRASFTVHAGQELALYTCALDGSDLRRLSASGNSDYGARWLGPDCRFLVYSAYREGEIDIWRMRASDGTSRRITFSQAAESIEYAADDGSMFTYTVDNRTGHVWLADPRSDPPARWRLTSESLVDSWPSAAASGTLAFQRWQPSPRPNVSLFHAELQVGQLENAQFLDVRPVAPDGGLPLLSADGEWLAYLRSAEGPRYQLWMLQLRTMHSRRIDPDCIPPRFYRFPVDLVEQMMVWAPTTNTLFYVASAGGDREQVRRFDAGAEPHAPAALVTGDPGVSLLDLSVSPDGQRLGYLQRDNDHPQQWKVRVLDLNARSNTAVWKVALTWDRQLSLRGWSADGDGLVVVRSAGGASPGGDIDVLRISLADEVQEIASTDHAFSGTARLDPSGERLYVVRSDTRGVHNLYSLDLVTGALRRLSENDLLTTSYTAPEFLPDGRLVYSRQETNRDIWLIRLKH